MDAVVAEVLVCTKCELWKTRRNAVPGEGNPEAQVMFIGEAPGYSEDIKGKPFVGDAGKYLDTLLSEIGLSREEVFVGNVLKCRPPRNRQPARKEIQACTQYLDRQINSIQPDFVVTLGSHSTSYIFSRANLPFNTITQAHGKFYNAKVLDMHVTIFPTYHPASALYSAKYKRLLHIDFRLLKKRLHTQPQ